MPTFEPLNNQAGSSTVKSLVLPDVIGIIVRVQDKNGQYIDVTRPIITKRPGNFKTWTALINDLEKKFQTIETRWQFYQLLSLQVNIDAAAQQTTEEDAFSVNSYIAGEALVQID